MTGTTLPAGEVRVAAGEPRKIDAAIGPEGAFLVGGPETVAAKMLHASETLGRLARISVHTTAAMVPDPMITLSIKLLGGRVAPMRQAETTPQQSRLARSA